jgi:serine/threonine-protein kinase
MMDGNINSTPPARSIEDTIAVPSVELVGAARSTSSAEPVVSLVEGSGPGMSGETQELLRCRLRMAALILFSGFAAFLVRNLVWLDLSQPPISLILWPHVVVTAVLGLFSGALCRGCDIKTGSLRVHELFVFGSPAAFLLLLQYVDMTSCAQKGFLPNPTSSWLLLIFTYALFIPNRWPRAAAVIGAMAVAPIVMTAGLVSLNRVCQEANVGGLVFISHIALTMSFAAVGAVAGVHTIGGLRRQAFQGKQLGQYRLRERIGAGGMGEVYLAEHQLMKRPCAIKLIRPEKAGDPQILARFEREVRASARLSHWNSIDIYDFGRTSDGTFYYVMEYLPGMNLGEMVNRYGPLPADRAIHFLAQTCDALAEAHQLGLIHRDLKPANIFAARRGGHHDVTKLLDFGLAKPLSDAESAELTQDGTITGSPLFMAPEQAIGEKDPDARSDIYSLGAVAYFLLSGRPPFDDEKPIKVLIAHAHDSPLDLTSIDPEVPRDLWKVVSRCLEKDPDRRYQNAAELAAALRQCEAAGHWDLAAATRWWEDNGNPRSEPVAAMA